MDFITSIIFIVIFLVFMVFVFSIGLLRPFMHKKELALVFVAAFIVGSLGGAFFLVPVYNDLPEFICAVEQVLPTSEETMHLDISYSDNATGIIDQLKTMDGVRSVKVTGITVYLSPLSDADVKTVNKALGIIDKSYESWDINKSGKIEIQLKENASLASALQSFSNWHELVYGDKFGYALVHVEVVVSSSSHDKIEQFLLSNRVVPSNVSGVSHELKDKVESSLLLDSIFVLFCGIFGIFVTLIGVYFDNIVVSYRKLRKWIRRNITKRKNK